ncbi:MAG: metallophosphoesterase [Haloarculaceae archaeon]
MITVVSDTHGESDHRLAGRTLEAVREADLVVHAGDLMTEAVLDAFEAESASFVAVRGNNDPPLDCLPLERVVEFDGLRLVVVHGHQHHDTAMTMLGREAEADLVVFGHSHRPTFDARAAVPRLNPGSHAHPRWYEAAHAELHRRGDSLEGRLVEPDGTTMQEFTISLGREEE